MDSAEILKRGDPKNFLKMKMTTLMAKMYYPSVLSDLFVRFGLEEATEHLNSIGDRAAKFFLQYYTPKSKTPLKLIKEMAKFVGESYKIRKHPKEEVYSIRTKKCPLCYEMPELDLPGLKNCEPMAGFINGFFKHVVPKKNPKNIDYTKYHGEITKSMGSGDKYCELLIKKVEDV